ncbi:threonine--tRNA ligase [Clostridium sp. D2Q-14]|uniref:threonine--tRNA ligase n=1 Tax=Anaeromonas gelatinilytica TaxID=2683194 RepID=UPI00193C8673|nr:threonine--tRNA ligase [Anaeromonas gelatinilytica]MBS4536283.1 threonine--tRNA ligase [Anaeromonas gelatinilytica]
MSKIKITLPDNSVREYEDVVSPLQVAKDISEGLARAVVGAEVDGKVVGLKEEIKEDAYLKLLKFDDKDGAEVFRHTSAHILANAVKRLFPDTKLAIGPAIDDGFYYDFDTNHRFTPEDLEKIEKEMKKIVKEDLSMEKFVLPRDEAIKYLQEQGEDYKVELVEDLPKDEEISFYKQGDFVDLCRGPHLPSTKKVKAFKLLNIAGAYWRGDENRKMLQRIYGTSFEKKKELNQYIERLEEAKKRDHRKLGKELGLFTIMEEGPGFPFFLPKGTVLKNELLDFWRNLHREEGYVEVETPIILSRKLWETSGHWNHYRENMYEVKIDEEDFAIKPMNCPGGFLVYKNEMHSYRDLPMRVAEVGKVHRHELSGVLHGLMRVRAFTQDDAHIFMLPEQIKDEIKGVVRKIDKIYTTFGFKYNIELSTRPEKSMGSEEDWNMAETALKEALEELEVNYILNEGDGAFYGPKIDFHLEDAIGRTWQCGTIQLDFQMPQRFELTYIGDDGDKHRPIIIHTAALGSIERFLGILIEHYAGKFPVWLSPVQAIILPISDKFNDYAEKIKEELASKAIKVEVDDRSEKIGYKIREAQLLKIPYMLVVGEKEVENNAISVRSRDEGDNGTLTLEDFVDRITKEIKEKS